MFTWRNAFKVIGLIIILLLIWLLTREGWLPWLESGPNMFIAMAVPVSLLAAWEVFKRARAAQANSQLTSAVVDQAKADKRPSGDVVQLRERFEEAIATLKQQKKQGGLGLYELPWYVIIGAPGSGKTTALKFSGLKFPLEQRSGRGALRGVGGTRNCDWWFTEEAVLLDTAGRYMTQDSDASADSVAWAEFLALLKKYRKRRPLNGVLLTISAHDLLTLGQAGREAHVAAARRRLNELNKELKIQLPVYVLVTKCDLIAGFAEYFDDMSQQDRAQVLGVTFPEEVTLKGTAAAAFPTEFDAVIQRLNERVYDRLEGERDGRRRAKVFGLPQQMASLRESLSDYVGEIFESTRFDQRVLLRGVYFTSGTQEGTPIDRLLGSLSRRFSVAAEALVPEGRGKAFFIERLMKEVVLAESGLAGASRRLELQKAAAQFGLYAAMLAVGVLGLFLLSYSYRTNLTFLKDFAGRVEQVSASVKAMSPGDSAVEARPRLDQIRSLIFAVRQYRDEKSWFKRGWGLDQSDSAEEAIGEVYKDELRRSLVGTLGVRFEQRLESLINDRNYLNLYLTLRAYLMLNGTSERYFDPGDVREAAKPEWAALYPGDKEGAARLDDHFAYLLDGKVALSDRKLKATLVTKARAAIPAGASPQLILALLERTYEKQATEAGAAPPITDTNVIKTHSGHALGEGLPAVYTLEGFTAAKTLIPDTEKKFREETWVWAGTPPEPLRNRNEVWQRYEGEYINQWDRVLKDIGLPPRNSDMADYITKIANERQGLKSLLQTVERHTSLVPAVYVPPPSGFFSDPAGYILSEANAASNKWKGLDAAPGTKVTVHYIPIHRLVTAVGDKVLIDEILAKMKPVASGMKAMQKVVGNTPSAGAPGNLQRAVDDLRQTSGGLPGAAASISQLVDGLVGSATKESGAQVQEQVRIAFDNFVKGCRDVIGTAYPFDQDSTADVAPDDLKRLFGPQFSELVDKDLAGFVVKQKGQYIALPLPDGSPQNIDRILRKLNEADRIREFLVGSGDIGFSFTVSVTDKDEQTDVFQLSDILFKDEKTFTYKAQEMNPKAAQWPAKDGALNATFDDGSRGTQILRGGSGPWNLFRLFHSLRKIDDLQFEAKLIKGDHFATLRLQTKSKLTVLGLFASGALQKFTCDR